jgi:serine/threonine-protein kinase 24/25/MST4
MYDLLLAVDGGELTIAVQRPTAKELLKHKFVRLAKKTNYLTELIERHERWKAEGGAREEEQEREREDDL